MKLLFGKIKKLQIKVPWTKISSAPVELVLESLMIVVAPIAQNQWKAKSVWSYEYKKKMLDEITSLMAAKLKLSLASKADSKDDSMGKRFLIKVIDNVQVTIKNIHIRYEDTGSLRTTPYSLGITLQEIAVNTTNTQWNKTFYDRNLKENREKPIFKRLQIRGLALYMQFQTKK